MEEQLPAAKATLCKIGVGFPKNKSTSPNLTPVLNFAILMAVSSNTGVNDTLGLDCLFLSYVCLLTCMHLVNSV